MATLQQEAIAHPGSYWIIGNEPNVGDGSVSTPAQYATELEYYDQNIKGADPTAKLVGPNVLNWDNTCTSCGGFPSGHTWTDQLRSAWATQFGGEPPIDVWALHAYSEDYNVLFQNHSLTDPTPLENDITGMSTYLTGIPAQATKSIWVTEFGIIWAFNGYSITSTGCPAAPSCFAPPIGTPTSVSYDSAGVTSFMNGFTTWAKAKGPAIRLQKWFIYIASGTPESYMTTYAGISTMTDSGPTAVMTTYGQLYQSEAMSP